MTKNLISKKVLIVSLTLSFGLLAQVTRADDPKEISQSIASTPALITQGKSLFITNCASCHGPEGKGDGPAAVAFNPKPRNFLTETFKQGASPSAVFHTMTQGLGSMPSFAALPPVERLALTHYILSLSPHVEKDSAASLAVIGLDPSGKVLEGFKSSQKPELPIEFIIERMATDGNVTSLDVKALGQALALRKEAAKPAPPVVIVPDLKRGKLLFASCAACHGGDAEGDQLGAGPQLAGQDVDYIIAQIKKFQTGVRGAHPKDVNGLRMRALSRSLHSEEDLISVAHYVSQLKPQKPIKTLEGGDPARGQAAYATCLACHGVDALGNKAMSAPAIKHLADWYAMDQIKKFKAGHRGADPRDATGATMRGMSMSLVDDQMIKDVIAYIETIQ